MKQFYILSVLVLFFASGCLEDPEISPISRIGRPQGWFVNAVVSNFDTQVAAAIASTDDASFSAADTTRAGVTAIYEARIAAITQVEACDRDDIIFFLQEGPIRIIQMLEQCPEAGDPTVLARFQDRTWSTDGTATILRIRNGGVNQAVYEVLEITDQDFRIRDTREVVDTLIGTFTYDIEYQMKPGA